MDFDKSYNLYVVLSSIFVQIKDIAQDLGICYAGRIKFSENNNTNFYCTPRRKKNVANKGRRTNGLSKSEFCQKTFKFYIRHRNKKIDLKVKKIANLIKAALCSCW